VIMRLKFILIGTVLCLSGCVQLGSPIFQSSTTTTNNQVSNQSAIAPNNRLIHITAAKLFKSSDGSYYAGGTITNDNDSTSSNIQIGFNVLDSSNKVLFTNSTEVLPQVVAGHGEGIFLYHLSQLSGSPTTINASIMSSQASQDKLPDVTVNTEKISDDSAGDYFILGSFTNNGTQPIEIEKVGGIGYDKNGGIIAVGDQAINLRYIGPGESSPYRVDLISTGPVIKGEIFIQSNNTSLEMPPSVSYEQTSNSSLFVDSNGIWNLIENVNNTGSVPLTFGAIASLYDTNGTLLDVASYSDPFFFLLPNQNAPIDFTDFQIANGNPGVAGSIAKISIQTDLARTKLFTGKVLNLAVNGNQPAENQSQLIITGNIENNSGEDLNGVEISAELRDKSGQLVGMGSTSLFEKILNGQNLPFTIHPELNPMIDPNQITVVYFAQSLSLDSITNMNASTQASTSLPITTSFPIVTTTPNPTLLSSNNEIPTQPIIPTQTKTQPPTRIQIIAPKAKLENVKYNSSGCGSAIWMQLSGFKPNSTITVTSSGSDLNCQTKNWQNVNWTAPWGKTDGNGSAIISYAVSSQAHYSWKFVDEAGNETVLNINLP